MSTFSLKSFWKTISERNHNLDPILKSDENSDLLYFIVENNVRYNAFVYNKWSCISALVLFNAKMLSNIICSL